MSEVEQEFNPEIVDELLYWVEERHSIHYRKEILGEDPPWTDDEILQSRHFCNPWRQNDRVTRYYIREYVGNAYDPEDVFFTTVMFRIFNIEEPMDELGLIEVEGYDPQNDVSDVLLDAEQSGELDTMFNSAYMITGAVGEKGERKVVSYARDNFGEIADNIGTYWWDHFSATDKQELSQGSPFELHAETDPDTWTDKLTDVPGISDFIAYEIYCDMTYHEWFPWDLNDYVNPGPGAFRGINRLYGHSDIESNHGYDYIDEIETVRDLLQEHLSDNLPAHPDVTLRTAEHVLCELDKFLRAKEAKETGDSIRLRKYDGSPTSTSTGLGSF